MTRKRKLEPPFFEIGPKNYLYGDQIVELARMADEAAEKYDVRVIFTTPYANIEKVAATVKHIQVFAPHMDAIPVGRGLANILPESLKAAGAVGVMLNHAEFPLSTSTLVHTLKRARELDFLVFACADTVDEAKALAQLHPDILNPEPSELIGGAGGVSDMAFVREVIEAIKAIDPDIMVEQAAGITSGRQVYDFIMAGSEAAGAASGIINAEDPLAMIDEMIAATRRAADDLKKQRAEMK